MIAKVRRRAASAAGEVVMGAAGSAPTGFSQTDRGPAPDPAAAQLFSTGSVRKWRPLAVVDLHHPDVGVDAAARSM